MVLSSLGSYLRGGITNAFQIFLFPFNILRRFSYSFFTVLANRLGQRGLTRDDPSNPATSCINPTPISLKPVLPKQSKDELEQGPPVQHNRATSATMAASDNAKDTIITLEDENDISAPLIPPTTPTSSQKRPSFSGESEKFSADSPAEKKPKLAIETDPISVVATESLPTVTFDRELSRCAAAFPESSSESLSPKSTLAFKDKSKKSNKRNRETKLSAKCAASFDGSLLTGRSNSSGMESKPDGHKGKDKPGQPRLNYFIGIQVNNPDIRLGIKSLQEKMVESKMGPTYDKKGKKIPDGIYREAMIKVERLHFTLHVMHLRDEEDIEKAKRIVQTVGEKFKKEFEENPMAIQIKGLGSFKDSVIFAKIQDEVCIQRLTALSNALKEEFSLVNIVGETRPFTPHMTIAKVSASDKLARSNIWKIPRDMWLAFEEESFGVQKVEQLQLLSMREKDSEGYYKLISGFPFVEFSNCAV